MNDQVLILPFNTASVDKFVDLQMFVYDASLRERGLTRVFSDRSSQEWVDYYGKMFSSLRQDPFFRVMHATIGDQTVGAVVTYSGQYEGFTSAGKIDSLVVHPDFWGRGIGQELVKSALSVIKETGANEAVLQVEKDNNRARKFWGRMGWRPVPGCVGFNEIEGRTFPVLTLEKNL